VPRAAVQFVTPKRDRRGQAGEPILRCDRAISSPRRKGSWPLAANLPKEMRFLPPSIRQYFPPICGLHHRSSFFLRLRSRLARQCQERTCRQGAVHERANEQLYPREPRTCLPTPSGSRSLADLAQSWGHHPSLWVCGAGRNFLWALPRASCRSAQPNCRLKVRVTPKADDIR
jgi:hypothetical protein